MKMRESGMPEEAMWERFFDPEETLRKLGLEAESGNVVDFGCGYGTFAVAAARITRGMVYALDIEQAMVEATRRKAEAASLRNVHVMQRDFMAEGSGLADALAGYAMLFNILHCEEPRRLLDEARRVLVPGGTLAVMHWNYDSTTPRGPSLEIRPRPEQCQSWALAAGFEMSGAGVVALPPYHYGLMARKKRL